MPRTTGLGTIPTSRTSAAILDPAHPLAVGLVAYWGCNDGVGTSLRDLSGGGATGTIQGTNPATTWTQGISGRGLLLNGTDNVVFIGQPPQLNVTSPFTLAVWALPLALGSNNSGMITRDTTASRQWNLMLLTSGNGGTWRLYANGATSGLKNISSNVAATLGVWSRVVGIWDGAALWLWVNGVRQTATTALTDAALVSVAVDVYLGRTAVASNSFFNGRLDELGIWRRAWSPAEVLRDYVRTADIYLPRMRQWITRAYTGNPQLQSSVGLAARAPRGTLTRGMTSSVLPKVRRQGRPAPIALGSGVALVAKGGHTRKVGLASAVALAVQVQARHRPTVGAHSGTAPGCTARFVQRPVAHATLEVT